MWKTFNEERCTYYRLVVKHSCDADSASIVLINHTKENSIALQSGVLSDAIYFNLTTYDESGNQCEELSLEPFRFNTESEIFLIIIVAYNNYILAILQLLRRRLACVWTTSLNSACWHPLVLIFHQYTLGDKHLSWHFLFCLLPVNWKRISCVQFTPSLGRDVWIYSAATASEDQPTPAPSLSAGPKTTAQC